MLKMILDSSRNLFSLETEKAFCSTIPPPRDVHGVSISSTCLPPDTHTAVLKRRASADSTNKAESAGGRGARWLPVASPTADPGARRSPNWGWGQGKSAVQLPPSTELCHTKKQLG